MMTMIESKRHVDAAHNEALGEHARRSEWHVQHTAKQWGVHIQLRSLHVPACVLQWLVHPMLQDEMERVMNHMEARFTYLS